MIDLAAFMWTIVFGVALPIVGPPALLMWFCRWISRRSNAEGVAADYIHGPHTAAAQFDTADGWDALRAAILEQRRKDNA